MLNRFYPGWGVHAACFICALIVVGTTSYVFGLFVVPVSEELGLSRATINNGFISFLAGTALAAPFAGRVLDKFSARLVIALGGLSFGLGMIMLSQASSGLVMVLLILFPIAFGFAICGTLGANTVIVRWFKKRRGAALGVMAVATSLGGFVFTPIVALLIEHFGWRTALFVTGAAACTLIPLLALLMIRNRPAGTETGYEQEFNEDEAGPSARRRATGEERPWTYAELFRNRNFWLVSVGITLLFASDQALIVSQIPHFQDAGITAAAAAVITSFMAMSAIGGKILVGYLADKVDLRWVFFVVAIAHMVLLVVYILMPTYWVLFALAVCFGIGIGGVFPVWSTLLAWLFGSKSYGTIMGLMTIPMKLSGVVTIRLVGEVYDRTGSYVSAFLIFSVMIAVAIVLVSMIRPPEKSVSGEPALAS